MNREQMGDQEDSVSQPEQDTPVGDEEPTYFGQVPEGEHIGIDDPNLKLGIIALAILAATILGLSLIFASLDKSATAGADGATNVMTEQNRLMREAIDMAHEAQAMNRQRMAEMRRAMEEAEGYADYAEFGEYADADADAFDYEP